VYQSATPDNDIPEMVTVRRQFDIRSMRKLKPRESLVWLVQYGDLSGTPSITTVCGQIRTLVAGL